MAIQATKPNNRVFLLLGVLLAALAFGGVVFALKQSGTGNTTNVVVAKQALAAGTTLTADQVTVASVPVTAAPLDAFTSPAQVVGKTTTAAVTQNTPIVPAFFAAPPVSAATTTGANGAPVDVETQIVKGYVAMAIPTQPPVAQGVNSYGVSAELAAAGFYISPGDHIDILVDTGSGLVRYAFQDLPVLRVGSSGTSGSPSLLIVEVPRNQAELLTALFTLRDYGNGSNSGPFAIKYVLRPESEWGKTAPDDSKYTPNYEDSGTTPLPPVNDTAVGAAQLNALFAH